MESPMSYGHLIRGIPWTIYWIHGTHFACFAILKFHSVNHCYLIRCSFKRVDKNRGYFDSWEENSIFLVSTIFFNCLRKTRVTNLTSTELLKRTYVFIVNLPKILENMRVLMCSKNIRQRACVEISQRIEQRNQRGCELNYWLRQN